MDAELTEVPPPNTYKNVIKKPIPPQHPVPTTSCLSVEQKFYMKPDSTTTIGRHAVNYDSDSSEEGKDVSNDDELKKRIEQLEIRVMTRLDSLSAMVLKISTNDEKLEQDSINQHTTLMEILSRIEISLKANENSLKADIAPVAIIPEAIIPEEQRNQPEGDGVGYGGGYGGVGGGYGGRDYDLETARIGLDEFIRIKEEGVLKHCWLYMSSRDNKAHKCRVHTISITDLTDIYSLGGSCFPYLKSCEHKNRFIESRIKFHSKKHFTHCREKVFT